MFLAHLPAGYLLAVAIGRARRGASVPSASGTAFSPALLLGSVAPDLDMVRWWLVDHGTVHHHRYFSHLPAVWPAVALLASCVPLPQRARRIRAPVMGLSIGVLLHVALDSLAGDIAWLWPFDARLFSLVEVPATHASWVVSYLTHWTMAIEALIIGAALAVWQVRRCRLRDRDATQGRGSRGEPA